MRRMMLLAPLVIACSVRSGCESASVRRDVGELDVEVQAHAVRNFGVGGFGIPHVGGLLWPEFDGYGVELRIRVDDRPAISVAAPAEDPEVEPDETELQTTARSMQFAAAPSGEHLAIALDALRGSPDALTMEAIEAQSAAQPWNDALLEAWPRQRAQRTLVARLEKLDTVESNYAVRVGGKTLPEATRAGQARPDAGWIGTPRNVLRPNTCRTRSFHRLRKRSYASITSMATTRVMTRI